MPATPQAQQPIGAYGAPAAQAASTVDHQTPAVELPEPADFVDPTDDEPAETGKSNRPSPVLLGLLAAVLIGGAAYNFVLKPSDETVLEPATPVAATTTTPTGNDPQGLGWAASVPRELPGGISDETTLDAREVAPKRFAHQVEILESLLTKNERIYTAEVQNDGTLVALVSDGTTARWAATKKDLDPQPTPPAAGLADSAKPLEPSDFIAKVPSKFLKAADRAGGVAPGRLILTHPTAGAFGDSPTWQLKWTGVNKTIFATVDGHDLKV